MADIPLIPGTLALDCYPASAQAYYEEMFNRGHGVIPDVQGILIQDAAPDPIYRGNKGWIPTSGGVPIYPGYVFIWHAVVGHWVSRHYKGPSDPRPEMYIGDISLIGTFDGGDANAPGIASGPMWEQWTAIDGRVPVGVGLIPGSSPAATITNVLDTQDSLLNSGEYKHTLTDAEGATGTHVHGFGTNEVADLQHFHLFYDALAAVPAQTTHVFQSADPMTTSSVTQANLWTAPPVDAAGAPLVTSPHNNMQPYIGVYWIKRTARQFYVLG